MILSLRDSVLSHHHIPVAPLPWGWTHLKSFPTQQHLPSVIEVKPQHCPDSDTNCWGTCTGQNSDTINIPDTLDIQQWAFGAASPLRFCFLTALVHEIMQITELIQSSRNIHLNQGWDCRRKIDNRKEWCCPGSLLLNVWLHLAAWGVKVWTEQNQPHPCLELLESGKNCSARCWAGMALLDSVYSSVVLL